MTFLKKEGRDDSLKKEKKKKKKKGNITGVLTLFYSLDVVLNEIRRFRTKEVKKKRLWRNEFIKVRDTLNVFPKFLQTMTISFFQARTSRPRTHVKNSHKVKK